MKAKGSSSSLAGKDFLTSSLLSSSPSSGLCSLLC